jgi:hypothetical protein
VSLYSTLLGAGETAELALAAGRRAWVQVARGAVTLNGTRLGEGDGAAVEQETRVVLTGQEDGKDSEVLVFDLG